jgi:hypothetical protein
MKKKETIYLRNYNFLIFQKNEILLLFLLLQIKNFKLI